MGHSVERTDILGRARLGALNRQGMNEVVSCPSLRLAGVGGGDNCQVAGIDE